MDFGTPEGARWIRRAIAAVIGLAAVAFLLARRDADLGDHVRLVSLVSGASHRILEGRLHGGYGHRPLRRVRSGESAEWISAPDRLQLLALTRRIEARGAESDGARVPDRAATALFTGEADRAISELDRAMADAKTDDLRARLASDLAAAYLFRSQISATSNDLLSAVDCADRAWRLAPRSAEALWNRALTIDALGLIAETREAWRAYLAVDPSSEWADEARQRLAAVAPEGDADRWVAARVGLEKAARSGDGAVVRELAARFPIRTRDLIEREWIPRWGALVAADRAPADRLWIAIAAGGEAIEQRSRDRLVVDFVESSGRDMAAFAAPHARITNVRNVLRENGTDAAIVELESVIEGLARVRSPMATVAAVELGGWHAHAGRQEAALAVLDRVAGRIDSAWPLTSAKEAWSRGAALTSLGQVTRGAASYARALEIYRASGDPTYMGMLHMLLADNAELANNSRTQWPRYLEAVRYAERHADVDRILVVLDRFCRAALQRDHPGVSRVLSDAVMARAASPDFAPYLCHAQITRSELENGDGNQQEAKRFLAAARATASSIRDEAVRQRLAADMDVAAAAISAGRERLEALTRAVDLSEDRRDHYRLSRVLLLRARFHLAQGALDIARVDLERGLDAVEEQRRRLEAVPDRVTYIETARGLADELVRLLVHQGDSAGAFQVTERVRGRALTESLDPDVSVVDSHALQRALRPDEALISYWSDRDELFVWVWKRDGLTFGRSAVPRERLRHEAGQLLRTMAAGGAFDARASVLFRMLFEPIERPLAPITRMIVVLDEPMAGLPLAALQDSQRRYLVERASVSVSASASAAVVRRRAGRLDDYATALVLANPETREKLPMLDVRKEIDAIRASYAAAVYERREATAAVLRAAAHRYDIVHIAAHGVEERNSGEPVLAFAAEGADDYGLLLASEAESLALKRGALVVLGACSSASGRGSLEGTMSLARAFQSAGAGSVIGALWDADDADSGALLGAFYAALGRGARPADALRAAQLTVIDSNESGHPGRWAAFQMYGGE